MSYQHDHVNKINQRQRRLQERFDRLDNVTVTEYRNLSDDDKRFMQEHNIKPKIIKLG